EANQFASYFLLPHEQFLKDFENIVGKRVSNPDQYVLLKKRYNVSIQALEYRAYKLGLLTPQQNSYFYRQISKKDYK
ncbi:ImmA/IrrE family metallo-endopeptidase, partial [Streptococcus ruminantium]